MQRQRQKPTLILRIGIVPAITPPPLYGQLAGGAHRHEALVRAGDGRDADFGVDIEDGGAAATARPRLDPHAGHHVVVVLVRGDNVLLEDDLLRGIARKGIARTARSRLPLREGGVALEARLDDGESYFVSKNLERKEKKKKKKREREREKERREERLTGIPEERPG